MKHFFLRLFAMVGVVFSVIFLLFALAITTLIGNAVKEPDDPDNIILTLNFATPVTEQVQDFSISLPRILYGEEEQMPLLHVLRALENAKNDPKVKGVVALFGGSPPQLVHAQEIAVALDNFRKSGKLTYVYAPSYGDFASGSTSYYLASHFENIWLQPLGIVGLTTPSIEAPFGKTALERLGITTDFMRREEYKSVMENVSRDSFSPQVHQNMTDMLASLGEQINAGISSARKIDPARAKELVQNGPYTSSEALKNGLIGKLAYRDEFEEEIKKIAGEDVAYLDPTSYLFFRGKELEEKPKSQIAIIYGEGLIIDNAPTGPAAFAQSEVIDTDAIVQAFKDAAENKDVKAIIFRVNSPGGSPLASETIRHALVKAKESKKPIFVSMGQVAASGGYWIAMNADRIIAAPATITGSIGVVSGKFVLGGLFDKLGIKWDSITIDKNAPMWSMRQPFDDKARARLNAMLDETYATFTDNVSKARNIPLDKMPDVAKGRVFTGEQAVKVGLVDELGGMNTTIDALKKQLKLAPTDLVELRQFPEPETPSTLAMRLLDHFGIGAVLPKATMRNWQHIKSTLTPLFTALTNTDAISARMPAYFVVE